MELKWKKGLQESELAELAQGALDQIDEKRYEVIMRKEGVREILKFGIAFSGKKVRVKVK